MTLKDIAVVNMNKIFHEDCLDTLKRMDNESINCVITSPPYYGLRDYGIDGQIGLEPTPEEYVSKLVTIFREIRRVLTKDGTVWLNLGDTYANNGTGGNGATGGRDKSTLQSRMPPINTTPVNRSISDGLKPKDLTGIPWRVAFALRNDGWWLRQDIIWHKPNPMPESVTDRCTKAHEYIFLLTKSAQYYYDAEAIMEKAMPDNIIRNRDITKLNNTPGRTRMGGLTTNGYKYANKRSVWTVTTKPFKEAHFATFPEDLIKPCILAGCPECGVVYDPFMGAGTTAVVALKTHRNFIGSEINADYIKIAENRIAEILQQYTLW